MKVQRWFGQKLYLRGTEQIGEMMGHAANYVEEAKDGLFQPNSIKYWRTLNFLMSMSFSQFKEKCQIWDKSIHIRKKNILDLNFQRFQIGFPNNLSQTILSFPFPERIYNFCIAESEN